MGIKDVMRRWAEKNTQKKAHFKQMQEELRLQQKLEDMQKSSNERELESYMKTKREEDIKKAVQQHRKKQQHDFWSSNIFTRQKSILHEDRPILKEKNIFNMKGNMFAKGNMLKSSKSGGGFI